MKLEGAAPAGFQTISIVGIRDPYVLSNPDKWLADLKNSIQGRLDEVGLNKNDYSFVLKPYGWNAVSGQNINPKMSKPLEIGLILVATGKTQKLATTVTKTANPKLLHFRAQENQQLPSFAFPFSPAEIEKGQVYEFKLNHVVDVSDPLELIQINYETINNKQEASL